MASGNKKNNINRKKEQGNRSGVIIIVLIICLMLTIGVCLYESFQAWKYKAAMYAGAKFAVFVSGMAGYCAEKNNMTYQELLTDYSKKYIEGEINQTWQEKS